MKSLRQAAGCIGVRELDCFYAGIHKQIFDSPLLLEFNKISVKAAATRLSLVFESAISRLFLEQNSICFKMNALTVAIIPHGPPSSCTKPYFNLGSK